VKKNWNRRVAEDNDPGHDLVIALNKRYLCHFRLEADADNAITDEFMPAASRNKRLGRFDAKWVRDQMDDGVINVLIEKLLGTYYARLHWRV